ncbi:permease for cytosine/purines, uracil, thiamine, allantoin-domain-containing protein [Lentinula raphanica]|nr:NCS cytosine-purine permease [Lentinula raphanica]KAJ3775574.1 permease for cytosine/purines, uracil, thiamine, allantoin-domain-containing protein [Lentinula raphanica]KAJ3823625.1 permease for cytosine/purines, uracil, thiamine, allantoin-domain-containing protein [Lentinula raphanica]KAJ3967395.1 permease for cytosine/purines, uracil, thiamine, allantoin-domain-containing protein [Lentinula raphanica]
MSVEKSRNDDLEKRESLDISQGEVGETLPPTYFSNSLTKRLLSWGVESRGISPVPPSQRTDTSYYKLFFLWFTINLNILSFSAGTLGPVAYGLGIRESCLVIFFFNGLCCVPPAYFATWGSKLGMRQMVQARYSFGYYGVILVCILNLITMIGFCILNAILGGQTLASVANGNLTWNAGIVIVVVISLTISFCGYSILTWYERIVWFPVLIVYLVSLGLGGKYLNDIPASEPATVSTILSYASTIGGGFVLTYSPLASDYTIYFKPSGSSSKIFIYTYLGLFTSLVSVQCLGAAFAAVALSPSLPSNSVPASWAQSYSSLSVGGLLHTILSPAGHFGDFLTVLLSLSVAGNIAVSFYSIGLNMQLALPALIVVPRYVFSIITTAIVLPLAIVGSHTFYDALEDFLGLIGYWCSAFIAVILVEHFVFRKHSYSQWTLSNFIRTPFRNPLPDDHNESTIWMLYYPPSHWNNPSLLPSGISAILAGIISFGLVVPSMSQIWFTGPIATKTGDIGFEVAFVLAGLVYMGLRGVEVYLRGKL